MEWIKRKLRRKVVRRVLMVVIAALLTAIGFSDEVAREFSGEGADIIIESL
jgi:VanZ family protein